MSEYAESIQDLVKRAFCDIAYSELDTLRRQYFIHGLRKEIAIQVGSLDPATFEQAYSIARRHETTLKLLQNSASAYVPNKTCHFNPAVSSRSTSCSFYVRIQSTKWSTNESRTSPCSRFTL